VTAASPIARRRRTERGMTLIEVMIAGVILLVAMLGFAGTTIYAATANAVGHRRSSMTLLRGGLVDRLVVQPRSALAAIPANTWVIDGCYDASSQPLAGGSNAPAYASGFSCPDGTLYRSWVSATANGNSTWSVSLYVERTDMGCTPATRASAVGCSSADLLLTD
jgi:prepilin-type N-terminal cleavage/methylation domain-containing protein